MSKKNKTINEMGLGMGAVAGPPGMRHDDPAKKLARGAFVEDDDLDMPPSDDMGGDLDDMGGDLDDMGGDDLGDDLEGGDTVECSKDELRELLSAVEMGEKTADEAFDQLCSDGECEMGDDLEGGDLEGDSLGGPFGGVGPKDDVYDECLGMEGVQRIANLLTDDPDIFTS